MKKIPLGKSGKFALVDDQDYEYLRQWSWFLLPNGYAFRAKKVKGKVKACYMHREVLKTAPEKHTDHVNGCRIDNRRENLRECTISENHKNRKKISGTSSKFKGVTWDKRRNKWAASGKINGKMKNLGRFECEKEAAKAYDAHAKEHYKQFARINNV